MITGSLIRCDLFRKLYLCGVNYNAEEGLKGVSPKTQLQVYTLKRIIS